MGITASGLGSGLDINSIVKQLMSAESKPVTALKTQQKTVTARLSAYGQLSSALATFQNSLENLSSNGLAAVGAASSSPALTASAGSGAVPATYAIEVTRIAQSHKLCSPGYASASADLGAGSLAIAIGSATPVTLAPASNSLSDLAAAINASGLTVTASVVNDGSANGQRLIVSGKDSGAANTITLTGSGALAALSYDPAMPLNFGYDGSGNAPTLMSQTQAAQDAQIAIDGLKITSPTNTVSGAIAGVTLQLTQTTSAPASVQVTRDSAAVKTAIHGFAKAWNELRTLVGTQTAYNEATKTGAALYGDSGPRTALSQLRATMSAAVAGAGAYDTLSDIGISFQKDGSLSVSDTKLQTAIDTRSADLQQLLAGTSGIATRLGKQLTDMLASDGVLAARSDGLNATLRGLGQRELALQARLDAVESRYRAQFTRLDAALTRMQGTSSWLGQQLSALTPK